MCEQVGDAKQQQLLKRALVWHYRKELPFAWFLQVSPESKGLSTHWRAPPLPRPGVINLAGWSLAFFARVAEAAKAGCSAHPAAEMEGRHVVTCWT